ncbi:YdcF family protein [Candidatus Saccharibacteria bacterium]|nr:YdcF family protein [Candidatus Saccharibacteria bacterium]
MKKFFGWLVAIILAILLVGFILLIGVGFYLSPQDNPDKADAIVVVSGGQTTSRAEKGIDLYKQGYAPNIIFSGASLDDGPSNAFAMRDQALASGIPAKDIYIDEKSQNTYENAVNSKAILQSLTATKVILVTSPYHQRRANQTFESVLGKGYQVLGVSAFDDRWSKSQWWRRGFPLFISASETWKLIYIGMTGNYK